MKKQYYINILEAVVLRSLDKTQECSLQVKTINSPAASFQVFCLHFRLFVFKNGQVSFLSSENLSFFCAQGQQQKIKRKVRDIFKVNNKDTTSISIVGLNRYFFVGYAVSVKVSQPALVYSKPTRNAVRCKNCDDLLHFRNFSLFGGLCITQSNIYDQIFIQKIVRR